jgi:hypothetical protein
LRSEDRFTIGIESGYKGTTDICAQVPQHSILPTGPGFILRQAQDEAFYKLATGALMVSLSNHEGEARYYDPAS